MASRRFVARMRNVLITVLAVAGLTFAYYLSRTSVGDSGMYIGNYANVNEGWRIGLTRITHDVSRRPDVQVFTVRWSEEWLPYAFEGDKDCRMLQYDRRTQTLTNCDWNGEGEMHGLSVSALASASKLDDPLAYLVRQVASVFH